jgi:hypothetical protein
MLNPTQPLDFTNDHVAHLNFADIFDGLESP